MKPEPLSGDLSSESTRPARIGIDVTAANTQGGGIGRFTRELVRALLDLDGRAHFHLFSARQTSGPSFSNPWPAAANVTYQEAPFDERWLYRLWYRLRLPFPVQWVTGPLDLFHSPDFVLPPVAKGIPTMLTVHDLSFVHYPQTFPPNLVAYLNRVVPWSIHRATHVLADSQATRNDLIDIWNVSADKITVLYGGVNERFRPIADMTRLEKMRAKYGLTDKPYLLSVGTLQPRKNYAMLIRAFRQIAARWPHNLIIAGDRGWLFDETLAEVERQGLEERVRFIGFVDDADLPTLYSGATLFAFPSLYEGFGLPLLEAMACGAPVISSDASSLPEVARGVGGEEVAVLLSPHQEGDWTAAIEQLLEEPARRKRMKALGFEQASRFSWRKTAAKLGELYDWLLEKPTSLQA